MGLRDLKQRERALSHEENEARRIARQEYSK